MEINAAKAIAHVRQDDKGYWSKHYLDEHLREVASLAEQHAESFSSNDWALLAGLWHDLGKYRPRFQNYIRDKSGYERENAHIETNDRPRHSTAGAIHAIKQLGGIYGHIVAYLIAGHHAGLPDWFGGRAGLDYRIKDNSSMDEYAESIQAIPGTKLELLKVTINSEVPEPARSMDSISLWMRILFSCLVDADFLDTEKFMSPEQFSERGKWPSLEELSQRFEQKMAELRKKTFANPLSEVRNQIYQQCADAAQWYPGLFSLTVPTGGGKTLSSLAFALEHAKQYGKSRVIYSIPFTSIIEQNADVFRDFLGEDAVLEHHSNLDTSPDKETTRMRLSSENWDAPLIVTTNVQLFESLHAARTSRCRKLHNLVNSVIILDEAQQLPRDFHRPITQTMQQMADYFGVTWVLCTATQPVLGRQENTFGQVVMPGLRNVREIIKAPIELSDILNKRVNVRLPNVDTPRESLENIAKKISQEQSVLCVVNMRKQARDLFQLLPEREHSFHLSAQMCANHRTEVIETIKERLENRRNGDNKPLRVVSTQLIEAGVDVDFPVVYRALAGLDSIAQSAGRCNRENKLPYPGKVIVFKPELSSIGFLRQGEDVTTELISVGKLDKPLSPESFSAFFKLLNSRGNRDLHDITSDLKAKSSNDAPLEIAFRSAAKKFRLIDNNGIAIIVPFIPKNNESSPIHPLLQKLEQDGSQRWIYRKLQRYTVSMPKLFVNEMVKKKCIYPVAGQLVLDDAYYHPIWGVSPPDTVLSGDESVF